MLVVTYANSPDDGVIFDPKVRQDKSPSYRGSGEEYWIGLSKEVSLLTTREQTEQLLSRLENALYDETESHKYLSDKLAKAENKIEELEGRIDELTCDPRMDEAV